MTTPAAGPVDTRVSVYDLDHRIIGEYGPGGNGDVRAEYIWTLPEVGASGLTGGDDGAGGYMPLAVVVGSGASAALRWVHGDHIGVPLVTTDATGAVVTPTGYALSGFPGQFANAVLLPGAAHYYNRYRDYDPTTGRYIQADPIGLEGDANPYAYALGNPLRYTDPTGEFVPIVLGFLVGAGIEYFGNDCASTQDIIVGGVLGTNGAGRLLYAGAAKVGARFASNGEAAMSFRNGMKRVMRGPLAGSNFRIKAYDDLLGQYGSDPAVQAAAGRTNPMINAAGGLGLGFGAGTAANCSCAR